MLTNFIEINFGPQHPAAHGVLRLVLSLSGEQVIHSDAHIGLLHRGTEKLIEYKTFPQISAYFDRLDYVSRIANEHCFSIAVEQILELEIPKRAQYIRIFLLELTRLLNHLIAITTHAIDVGALTPFLWRFEEREQIIELYEQITGARIHANYIRPGGVYQDVTEITVHHIHEFVNSFFSRLVELQQVLTKNNIWKTRLKNIGITTLQEAVNWNITGVILRSTGLAWDLRKVQIYEDYEQLNFTIPVGINGDCYDRYLIRLEEIFESIIIIQQILLLFPAGIYKIENIKFYSPTREFLRSDIEALIHHFKLYTEGYTLPTGLDFTSIEAPKGEFGVGFVTDDTNRPYRCKITAPGFFHLQSLNVLIKNYLLADLVTILGSIDIVFGEIDR